MHVATDANDVLCAAGHASQRDGSAQLPQHGLRRRDLDGRSHGGGLDRRHHDWRCFDLWRPFGYGNGLRVEVRTRRFAQELGYQDRAGNRGGSHSHNR